MGSTRDNVGKVGLAFAGLLFRLALYVCAAVLIFWGARSAFQFGHDVFDQEAMSPEYGQEVTVVIQEGSSAYKIGKTLESKGLIKDAKVFWVQELLSNYHNQMKAGTYLLSTAYTPSRMMEIMAGADVQEETDS